MIPLHYFAGFGPKDLMGILYFPAFGIILLASITILILKRRGHPYPLATMVFPVLGLFWYLYDRLRPGGTVDRSQAIILLGAITVFGIFGFANTSVVPGDHAIINNLALLATISAIGSFIAAFTHQRKTKFKD